MKKSNFILKPISIAFIYVIVASLWIIYSDYVIRELTFKEDILVWFLPVNSLVYIIITAIILYLLINAGQSRLKRSSKRLIDEKKKYQLLVDESPFAIIAHQRGKIIFANPSAITMLDATQEKDLIDVKIGSLLHPLDKEASKLRMKMMEGDEDPRYPVELRLLSLKKKEIQVEVTAHAFKFNGEMAVQVFLMNIGERIQNEKSIKNSLDEKIVLLSEINHRVKNNMAIISALIQLQSYEIEDHKVVELLNDSVSRIKSIAMIHEKLYQSQNMNIILFDEYIMEMTGQISKDVKNHPGIQFNYQLKTVPINLNQAVSCALFLNEVIGNLYKYTHESSIECTCLISCYVEEDCVFISISDNNQAHPDRLNPSKKTLTLQLMELMASQLSGELDIQVNNETIITLSFARELNQKGSAGNMNM